MAQRDDALDYHAKPTPGKISVVPSKPCDTQRYLSLAYSPGVARPCQEIVKNPEDAYLYTNRGNLVAVITDGSAVLGLGNIGALAGKPVMEGKAVLFKRFAGVDVFDIELRTQDPEEVVQTVKNLEPTFGGINLEDIAAPACFEIEERLQKEMAIPVFHDDQHGTAIVAAAGLFNALEITGKKMDEIRVVICGAGAAGIGSGRLMVAMGVKQENVMLADSKGVCYKGRTQGMNQYKEEFAVETDCRTLADALKGADVFLGLSVKGMLTQEMVKSMADQPIVFAMANPDPEISYEDAIAARKDIIFATGRSDYPNQVNNVLGFPFIFRGALDVRATTINLDMKIAAARALAALAKEEVPEEVRQAYEGEDLKFGPLYIIPKPFDPRVVYWVSPAVAQAAMETGVAQKKVNIETYKKSLQRLQHRSLIFIDRIFNEARRHQKRIGFAEGEHERVLQAADALAHDKVLIPVLIGDRATIRKRIEELSLTHLHDVEIVDPHENDYVDELAEEYYALRQRKGLTMSRARVRLTLPGYLTSLMLHHGIIDGYLSGMDMPYGEALRPALQILKLNEEAKIVSGLGILIHQQKTYFFTDCSVNIDLNAENLAQVAINAVRIVRQLGYDTRVAMLSFSNFGSVAHPKAAKVRKAMEIVRETFPEIEVDGEMQADAAIDELYLRQQFPFSRLTRRANILVFPNAQTGNIAFKLVQKMAQATVIGPLLVGLRKPVNILQRNATVEQIINLATLTAIGDVWLKKLAPEETS